MAEALLSSPPHGYLTQATPRWSVLSSIMHSNSAHHNSAHHNSAHNNSAHMAQSDTTRNHAQQQHTNAVRCALWSSTNTRDTTVTTFVSSATSARMLLGGWPSFSAPVLGCWPRPQHLMRRTMRSENASTWRKCATPASVSRPGPLGSASLPLASAGSALAACFVSSLTHTSTLISISVAKNLSMTCTTTNSVA